MHKNAVIVLSDGRHFFGESLGNRKDCIGEVCFTTGFTGYQYTITDPSFAGQIITFAFPHIGNVGVNKKDFECTHTLACGVVVREMSHASHISSYMDFNSWLTENGLSGISGVDTRALIRHLREHGTQNGIIHHCDDIGTVNLQELQKTAQLSKLQIVASDLSYLTDYAASKNGFRVCVIDLGAKRGILDSLTAAGCAVHVVAPKGDFAARILSLNPQGIVISNGPGDPADISVSVLDQIRNLLDTAIPMLGICLGHQLLATVMGAKTIRLNHGHRGSNHPVYNKRARTVEITSQNHSFTIDASTLPKNVEVTHVSLFDGTVEGIRLIDKPVFSVQYHPEGCPGPSDSHYIFQEFLSLMQQSVYTC